MLSYIIIYQIYLYIYSIYVPFQIVATLKNMKKVSFTCLIKILTDKASSMR